MVKPLFIDQIDHNTENKWIYNILDGNKETENLIYENKYFKLMKDLKFNEDDDIKSLYLIAIVKQRDLLSIRDLTREHLSMLMSIRDNSINVIEQKYGVKCACPFFHYLPQYFHLHVHFVHINIVMFK